MATVTTLKAGGTSGVSYGGEPLVVHTHEIDLMDSRLASALATGDLVSALTIPADSYFELLQVEVVTAITGTTQIDIGDETDDDELVAAATTLTAGTNLTIAKATVTGGAVPSAADTVNIKLTGTPTAGVLRLSWLAASTARNAIAKFPTASVT